MAVPASLFVAPVGILFLLSGLVVNVLQAVLFVLVRPWSKRIYRRGNKVIAELLWLELIWLIDWWGGIKIEVHADSETFELLGKEHALVLSNHRGDIDWLVGWVLAQRSGCLGSSLAIMKKEIKFLPVFGWSMWFSDYIFLERNWAKDEHTLKSKCRSLEDFPVPFWLALFVEGTRFTQQKLVAAQHYAASRGLPIPRNVLIPRTKGFVSAVTHMRSFVPAVYDCTLALSPSQPSPTLLTLLGRRTSVVKVEIKRHLMRELPATEEGMVQWCRDIFVTKDALLEKFISTGAFSELEARGLPRPKRSLLVVLGWSCLVVYGIVNLFQRSPHLSSWQGVALCVAFLMIISAITKVLLWSSQSERSTQPALPLHDPLLKEAFIETYAENRE